jgi:sec-independent protein translocase protein TatA
MNLGPTELLILFAIIMLLFGASKLPKLARSLGESSREFKNATAAVEGVDEPHETKVNEPTDTKVNEPHDTRSTGGPSAG